MGTYIVSPGALSLTEKPEGFGFEIIRREQLAHWWKQSPYTIVVERLKAI